MERLRCGEGGEWEGDDLADCGGGGCGECGCSGGAPECWARVNSGHCCVCKVADPKDSDDLYCIQLMVLPRARRYDNALVLSMVSPKCLCVRLYNLGTHWEVMQKSTIHTPQIETSCLPEKCYVSFTLNLATRLPLISPASIANRNETS